MPKQESVLEKTIVTHNKINSDNKGVIKIMNREKMS